MSTSRKYGKVTVRSTVGNLLAELGKTQGLPNKIKASIYSEIEYAVFVEFGTYRMSPRAMIRRSLPAIEAEFSREWRLLPFPPTTENLLDLVNRVVDFGLEIIRKNTPVLSDDLKKSWTKESAKPE